MVEPSAVCLRPVAARRVSCSPSRGGDRGQDVAASSADPALAAAIKSSPAYGTRVRRKSRHTDVIFLAKKCPAKIESGSLSFRRAAILASWQTTMLAAGMANQIPQPGGLCRSIARESPVATTDPVARHALRITPRSACPWRSDPAGSDLYRSQAIASVEQFGGRFLVYDAEAKTLDGQPAGNRVTIIEFAALYTFNVVCV
jgi:hypothetical protein